MARLDFKLTTSFFNQKEVLRSIEPDVLAIRKRMPKMFTGYAYYQRTFALNY
jgi:hypothetical protein